MWKTKSFPGRIIRWNEFNIFNNYYCQGRCDWKREKKVYTLLTCPVFLPKISVKQWGREKLQKEGHNFYIFLIVFLFSRTTLKLIENQEKL